jgi:hypothetical protein
VPSAGIPEDSCAERMRITCGELIVPVTCPVFPHSTYVISVVIVTVIVVVIGCKREEEKGREEGLLLWILRLLMRTSHMLRLYAVTAYCHGSLK